MVAMMERGSAAGTLGQSALTLSTLRGRVHQTSALHLEQQSIIHYNNVFSTAITCSTGPYVSSNGNYSPAAAN